MMHVLKRFERIIVILIIIMMMFIIAISTIELGVILVKELLNPPKYLLNINNLLEIFGFFFMILIGLELLHTIKTYLIEDSYHVEIVLVVAMIAMARKFIVLELRTLNPLILIGMASIILALAISYYLVKKCYTLRNPKSEK